MNFKLLYTFIFLAICTYNQSKPMNWLSNYNNSDSPIVTEPYQPSFSARYPKMSNLLQSSALGGFAALCAHRQSADNPSLAIGAATFATVFAYNALLKKPSVLDSLLTNPSVVLHQIDKATDKFQESYQIHGKSDLEKQLSIYQKLKKETKRESPLFLLGECTEGCALSRAYQSDYRKIYENRVVEALSSKSKILQQPIQYTSFGCGGMLQDLVIITKFLAQNPHAKIDIHLIDWQLTPYCDIRNLLNKTLDPNDKIDLTSNMNEIIKLARTKWEAEKLTDDEIKKHATISYIRRADKGKQFISYIRKTFPNAQTSLCLHSNTNDYFTYLNTHQIPYADIVTAADIMDEMSLLKKSIYNYVLLCIKTLQNKPESINIWLDKENYTQAEIMSVSLENSDGIIIQKGKFKKTELELDSENKIPFFWKIDNITKDSWLGSIIKRIFGIFRF